MVKIKGRLRWITNGVYEKKIELNRNNKLTQSANCAVSRLGKRPLHTYTILKSIIKITKFIVRKDDLKISFWHWFFRSSVGTKMCSRMDWKFPPLILVGVS